MSDVAQAAGVSLKSVSRVINGEKHVSGKLRDKVRRAIEELAYVPDISARSLAGNRSFTIGMLFDNPSPSYTMKIQAGAYEACRAAGYHLRIDNLDSQADTDGLDSQIKAILQGSRADGYVLTPPLTDCPQLLATLDDLGIRYVRVAPVIDPGRSHAIDFDDRAAARAVADHFLAQGHCRFGFVGGPEQHGRVAQRREGYVARIREVCGDAPIVMAEGAFDFASGLRGGSELLEAREPPTAIFAANDDMAAGVLSAAAKMGLKLPDDVSICGFDDSWIALSVWPPLTTIHQPITEMGRSAVELLLQPPLDEIRTRMLNFKLVERSSTTSPLGRRVTS